MPSSTTGNELISANLFELVGVEKGMKVGDLGCGNLGYFTIPTAKIVGKDGVVYAVDILKPVLQSVASRARQEGLDNIKIIWSNLEIIGATKIPAGSLDIIFLVNILFQSDKDDLVIKEAERLLRVGGKLAVVDWTRQDAPFGPPIKDRTHKEEIKNMAKQAGLNLVQEFEAGRYHYGLIFIK